MLPTSDSDLAALLDAMPMSVAVFSADRLLRFANRNARTLLGMDTRELGTAPTIEMALAPLLSDIAPLLRAATTGLPTHVTTARVRDSYGAELLVEVRISIAGEGMLLFVATDVTSRETLVTSLERRARELAAIFDITPTMVRVFDASGAIVRANANAIREHAGKRPGTLRELWDRDDPAEPSDLRPLPLERHPGALAIAGDTVRSRLLSVRRGADGGRVVIEVFAAPIFDAERRIMGAVLVDRDVTHEHKLALDLDAQVKRSAALHERVSTEAVRLDRMVEERSRELLALQEARARERRLSAVGQLAAGVMHDVNNALNPIMAAAYLLRLHADKPDAVRDYADRIGKAAETGAATASRVGRFIRQEPTSIEANELMDLSVATEEVLSFTQPLHTERGDGIRVEFARVYATGVTIRGIAGEIREALLNLVQNAVHAMPRGGTITARTGVAGLDAWVSITDTGQGMTDDVRERAFEPFFSTKGAGGSGLGLAEVYGIVRRHRGRAEIASQVGEGTTVTLYFPFESASAIAAVPDGRGAVPSQRVLVVEDHDDGREFLRQLLLADGHTVEAVSTYDEASRLLSGPNTPPFDVLLTDIGLPDGSGWKLVSHTRKQWPAVRIGVVTGWEPTVVGDDSDGADFILRKPLRAVELLAHVAGHFTTDNTEGNDE